MKRRFEKVYARLLCGCGAALMVGMYATTASANLLSDGSFEGVNASSGDVPMSSGGPWSGWNNWVAPYSSYYTASVPAEAGSQVAKTFSGPNAGVYQTVSGTAGTTYTASAYFENYSGDPMAAAETDDVRIIFEDASSNTLATDVSSSVVSNATAPNTWTQLSVTGLAPANTAKVEVMGFFNNPNYAGGSLFMDNADLEAAPVPEPASIGLLGLSVAGLLRRRRH